MFIKKTNASLIFTTFFVNNVSATLYHVASATDCKEAAVVCVLTFYVNKQHKTNKIICATLYDCCQPVPVHCERQ